MSLSPSEKKELRAIGHQLNPIITIAGKGITETIEEEIERALNDHELIKIKLNVGSREIKTQMIEAIVTEHHAELVQAIGKVALILRRAEKPNIQLSNLHRYR